MKLALALGSLVLVPWSSPRPPQVAESARECRVRILDARTLQIEQDGRRAELTLAELPEGARLHAAEATPILETGTVVALAVASGDGYEYRALLRRDARDWGTHAVAGSPEASEGWWVTPPFFVEEGEAWRIVDVHSPGSDSYALTFRRGWPRVRGADVDLDEVIVLDECASTGSSPEAGWVHVLRAQGRPL